MKRLALISITLLVLLLSSLHTTAVPIHGDKPKSSEPSLIVQKWISDDQVLIGENITVHVNITNISNDYAYNLSIVEPFFNGYVIKTQKLYDAYTYTRLGKGANIYYEYVITPSVKGQFTIESTSITFASKGGFVHRAKSAIIHFEVNSEAAPLETNQLWKNVLWMSLVIVGIPMVIYFADKIIKR